MVGTTFHVSIDYKRERERERESEREYNILYVIYIYYNKYHIYITKRKYKNHFSFLFDCEIDGVTV